jgi:hypothetical protein
MKTSSRYGFYPYLANLAYRYRIWSGTELKPNHPESDAIQAFILVLDDGDVFWDVESMSGSYTRYARAACNPKSLHVFEPNQIHFEECERTVSSLFG